MNTKPTNAIAVYTTFSQEFIWKCQEKNYRYRATLRLKTDIKMALLKYAYKKYFNIEIDDNILNVRTYFQLKEYDGLYFTRALGENFVIVAIGGNPLAIGAASRPLTDEWQLDSTLLHVNEFAQYQQSGYSPETLCWIWSKKDAYRKLHDIKQPSDADPFDCSFQKDIDGTLGQYSLHHFVYKPLVHYVAVTGKAEFAEVPIEEVFNLDK